MKNPVEAIDVNEEDFRYLVLTSRWISDGGITVGILIGLQTKEVTNGRNFDKVIEGMERKRGNH
jgi:hypothetical protein